MLANHQWGIVTCPVMTPEQVVSHITAMRGEATMYVYTDTPMNQWWQNKNKNEKSKLKTKTVNNAKLKAFSTLLEISFQVSPYICLRKSVILRGLVNIYACMSLVGQSFNSIFPQETCSLRTWCLVSMCLVLACIFWFLASSPDRAKADHKCWTPKKKRVDPRTRITVQQLQVSYT